MNIPLNVLINAEKALEMLRHVADKNMDTPQFMQAMRAHSELSVYIKMITERINVGAEAWRP